MPDTPKREVIASYLVGPEPTADGLLAALKAAGYLVVEETAIAADYFAFISVGGIAGCWGRSKTKEEAIATAARIFKADFKPAPDKPTVTVNVYDVTGRDKLTFGVDGVYSSKTGERIDRLEVVEAPLPARKGRKAA